MDFQDGIKTKKKEEEEGKEVVVVVGDERRERRERRFTLKGENEWVSLIFCEGRMADFLVWDGFP